MNDRYNKEKLEEVRDSLTLHLNELYAEEQTIDNYDKLKDLTEALEFCLEIVKTDLKLVELADKWCDVALSPEPPIVARIEASDFKIGPDTPN